MVIVDILVGFLGENLVITISLHATSFLSITISPYVMTCSMLLKFNLQKIKPGVSNKPW